MPVLAPFPHALKFMIRHDKQWQEPLFSKTIWIKRGSSYFKFFIVIYNTSLFGIFLQQKWAKYSDQIILQPSTSLLSLGGHSRMMETIQDVK